VVIGEGNATHRASDSGAAPASPETAPTNTGAARRQLMLLASCLVLGMTPWFSSTVAGPAMLAEWHVTSALAPWLTMAVQLGFVGGTLLSGILMLADRVRAERLAAYSALAVALTTSALALWTTSALMALILRALTGVALAGVYPPGIKLVAGWWRERRGLAIGILIGALTIGSAAPHLFRALIPIQSWRALLLIAGGCSLIAASIFRFAVQSGPFQAPAAPFSMGALRLLVRNRGVVLATCGYLGHMWELYAAWSWIGTFWGVAATKHHLTTASGSSLAFFTVAVGALGCAAAGRLADRYGRTSITMGSMIVSGCAALMIGFLLAGPLYLLIAIATIWGISMVADSAQFSACITELAPAEYVGTALTLQTCLGFLLTVASIRLVPYWVATLGWRYAFAPLAIGPFLGVVAMGLLRRDPLALRLAGGAR
jgi:MFS family permease